jgi:hypothetical protein
MIYYTLSIFQLFIFGLSISVFSISGIITWDFYNDRQFIPEVIYDKTGACINVINYQNGDAFNCQDVDGVLRKYKVIHDATEKM